MYCSVHGSDWQPSCVSAGCGSRKCCKLGIQALLQLLTEAGMLQAGSPWQTAVNKCCVARGCSDEGVKPGQLGLVLVIIKLQG